MYPCALIWGTLPSTTSTQLLRINFPSHSWSQLPFSASQELHYNKGKVTYPISALCSPTCLLQWPTLPLITRQGKIHVSAALFRLAARRWMNVSFEFHNFSSLCIHFVLPLILTQLVHFISHRRSHCHSCRGEGSGLWQRWSKHHGTQLFPSPVHLVKLDDLDWEMIYEIGG